jgi:ferredoxin-NADP reductase
MNNSYIELKIIGLRQETSEAKSFILDPVGDPVFYKAGQFLTLVFPEKLNGNRRSYSISSTPYLREPLTITVKRLANGEFSRYLIDKFEAGDSLYTIGPAGFFVLPPDPAAVPTYVFYAAGSGITPILPLIKTILVNYPGCRVYLTYSNRSADDTIFLDELRMLENKYAQLRIEWLFSNAKHLLKARLSKWRVEQHVNGMTPLEKESALFYLCGPHSYMQMISITLLREGIVQAHIRKEIFDNIKPLVRELPPDTHVHKVTVIYKGIESSFDVQYPETILAKALRMRLQLPYSCEAGKCGTCAATCMSGEVWMSYNEVLLDKEIADGRVLTCTGHPIKGDVVLHFPPPEGMNS